MVVLERLSSRREGVVVIDSFFEAGVVERYPEVFKPLEVEPLGRALERATTDDTAESPDLRIEDDGIGV